MTLRFSKILRGRPPNAARHGATCDSCGKEVLADGHAIQLAGGSYHAGCVLYRPRPHAGPPPRTGTRLRATR